MKMSRVEDRVLFHIITFSFASDTTTCPIETQTNRLKNKLVLHEKRWCGQLLLYASRATLSTVYIYNALASRITKTQVLPFFILRAQQFENNFLVSDRRKIFLLKADLTYNEVYSVPRGQIFRFEILNNGFAVGTTEELLVLDVNFNEIKSAITIKTHEILQLSSGKVATMHRIEKKVIIWDTNFTEKTEYTDIDSYHCCELPSNVLCIFGLKTVKIDLNTGTKQHFDTQYKQVHALSNNVSMWFDVKDKVQFFRDDTEFAKIESIQTQPEVIQEIKPGVAAWQGRELLYVYNINNRMKEDVPIPKNMKMRFILE
jgi:hypothetical protein